MTAMSTLAGKNIVITGATSGIGEAIAAAMDKAGAKVFIGGRRAEKGNQVASALSNTTFHVVDTASEDSNKAFMKAAETHFGGPQTVDYIFLNAGVEGDKTAMVIGTEAFKIDSYDFTFGVNVRGVLMGMQYGTPLLRKGGNFVVTSSVGSVLPFGPAPIYAASKAAVDSIVRCYAAQFKESEDEHLKTLSVYSINPTAYTSEMTDRFTEGNADMMIGMSAMFNVGGRPGTPEELSKMMVELVEGKLPYKSGDHIAVDTDMHFPVAEYFPRITKATAERSAAAN